MKLIYSVVLFKFNVIRHYKLSSRQKSSKLLGLCVCVGFLNILNKYLDSELHPIVVSEIPFIKATLEVT